MARTTRAESTPSPSLTPPVGPSGWPLWGHDSAVAEFRRALAQDRLSHAYLISGPAGVGKRTLATLIAQALCCQSAERPDRGVPCGTCLACRKVARGVHPDVQRFDLASQAATAERGGGKNTSLTIETVRELSATVALRPMEARRRVVIIDDAETMQGVAQEALLKTLEEPPSAVTLLVLTDDVDALLPTIQSRCRLVGLQSVPRAVVLDVLRASVAAGMIPDQGLEVAATGARGRPGWALRAAADARLVAEWEATVDRALGWIAGDDYQRLVDAVRLGDTFAKRRAEVFTELETLLGVWRDALLLRAELPRYAVYSTHATRLRELTAGWELGAVARAVQSVQTCLADLEGNVRPRLALEAMVLEWPAR